MPIDEKVTLLDQAEALSRATAEWAFKEGATWILLCGDPQIIRASAKLPKEILEEVDVLKIARTFNKAPFQFSAPLQMDDIWSGACNSDGDVIKGYPTVRIKFVSGNASMIDAHFDTGSARTFFRQEFFENIGILLGSIPGRSSVNGKTYYFLPFKVRASVVDQASGATKDVLLIGEAVLKWAESYFRRSCGESCSAKGKTVDGVCKYRTGLVGRNLLSDNKLSLILDGELGQTRIFIDA